MIEPHKSLATLLLDLWDGIKSHHWERWGWSNDNGFEYPMTFLNFDPLDIINHNPVTAVYSMPPVPNHDQAIRPKQEMDSQ